MGFDRAALCRVCLGIGITVSGCTQPQPEVAAAPQRPAPQVDVPVTAPAPTPFSATFLDPRGDAGWVETDVRANEDVAGVDARVNGGSWQALLLTDRGSWGASVSVPEEGTVEFRARTADGRESISPPYRWSDVTPVGGSDQTPVPDLVVSARRLASSWYVSTEYVDPNSCTLVEGCVGGSGWRKLLRFDTEIQNVGTADLVLGDPKTSSDFEFSPCHGHYHLTDSVNYSLLTLARDLAAEGHKQAFCWSDNVQVSGWDAPQHYPWSWDGCNGNMGLSRGWGDVYEADLDCQFIDVTEVPSGEYLLSITVNPLRSLPESDYGNNTAEATIRLP